VKIPQGTAKNQQTPRSAKKLGQKSLPEELQRKARCVKLTNLAQAPKKEITQNIRRFSDKLFQAFIFL